MCHSNETDVVGSIVVLKTTILFSTHPKEEYFIVASNQPLSIFQKFAEYLKWVGILDEGKAVINCDNTTLKNVWNEFFYNHNKAKKVSFSKGKLFG